MTMQEELNAIYRRLVDSAEVYRTLGKAVTTEQLLDEVDGPFLIATNDDYEAARPRLIIVGQENNRWAGPYRKVLADAADGPTKAIDRLVEGYGNFWREQPSDPYNVCFFQRIAKIRRAIIGNDSQRHKLLWLNLFKFNQGRDPQMIYSAHRDIVLKWQANVVQEEIRILCPNVVIFLTGPDYDPIISRFYPDAAFRAIDEHPLNELALVIAHALPSLTFRVYHPNYFNRIEKEKPYCYQAIIDRILKEYPQAGCG